MSLISSLNIGRQGLVVSQVGLQVTGQNIANVNTAGYKRQTVEQANLPYGLGVKVADVQRQINRFAEARLLGVTSDQKRADRTYTSLHEMEEIFNEVANRGLDEEFTDLFQAIQDLSTRPAGAAERSTLRSRGESIGNVFDFYHQQLSNQIDLQDQVADYAVDDINGIIQKIADTNRELSRFAESDNPMGRNELLNTRDEWVRKLSELVPVTVDEDNRGNFTLYLEQSMPLVINTDHYQLESRPQPDNDLKRDIYWVAPNGAEANITSRITSGDLGGILDLRDRIIPAQMSKLDRLAAEFVLHFNEQHRQGVGLDGVGGRNFFETIPVYGHATAGNDGGADITASAVVDETALTLDDYEVRFTAADAWEVVNTTTGAAVASGAYTPGDAIVFDGISVTVDSVSGPPAAGDSFVVNTVTNAAGNVRISDELAASTSVIAAGFTGETGDNRNALALADLENTRIIRGGTLNFREAYQAMIVDLGVAASVEDVERSNQEAILNQTQNLVESVSGVNIDEEATFLISYQRAYQASSRVISITDTLLETLIQMV